MAMTTWNSFSWNAIVPKECKTVPEDNDLHFLTVYFLTDLNEFVVSFKFTEVKFYCVPISDDSFSVSSEVTTASLTVNETDSTCVLCQADCWPDCNVTWTGPNGLESEQGSLCFSPIYRKHSGTYKYTTWGNETNEQNDVSISITVQCEKILFLSTFNWHK